MFQNNQSSRNINLSRTDSMETFGKGNLALSLMIVADRTDGKHRIVQYCAARACFS
jgi:hypothetical protein